MDKMADPEIRDRACVPLDEFRTYIQQFTELVTDLSERRAPYLNLAPRTDPLRIDEAEFRRAEMKVFTELSSLLSGAAAVVEMLLGERRKSRLCSILDFKF